VLIARTQGGLEETDDAIRAATGRSATLLPLDLQKDAEKQLDFVGPPSWSASGGSTSWSTMPAR
jgi:hypothetical protein